MNGTRGGADVRTDRAVVLLTDRPVIPLSPDIAAHLAECEATGRVLQIVSPPDVRATVALCAALDGPHAQWIVADEKGYYDGTSGRPMLWDGTVFSPEPEARDYAPSYLAPLTAPLGSLLLLNYRTEHARTHLLGGQVEELVRTLTGHPPTGWGPAEPLAHPWSRDELTAHVDAAAARRPVRVLVAGRGRRDVMAVATFEYVGNPSRLTESTTVTAAHEPHDPPPVAHLPHLVETLIERHPVTSFHAALTPGSPDLTAEPRWTGSRAPVGLAVTGHRPIPPTFTGTPIGPPHAPMTWFPIGDGHDPEAWHRHRSLLNHLNPTI